MTYHRRSGVLKTTSQQALIAQQRSEALYRSVSDGDLSIDAILALPIDWQGAANEHQWRLERRLQGMEEIPTMNPLTIKTRPRSRQQEQSLSFSLQEDTPAAPLSALGLDVDVESDCSSSPGLCGSNSQPTSPSSSDFSIPSPPATTAVEDPMDSSFDLKSYCSAFSDVERPRQDWWASRPIQA